MPAGPCQNDLLRRPKKYLIPKLPELVEALNSKDASLRGGAAWNLGQIGPEAKIALPSLLIRMETDRNALVRIAACYAVFRINGSPEALHNLLPFFGSQDPAVRRDVVAAFEKIGPGARSLAPELVKRLRDGEEWDVSVIEALGYLGEGARNMAPALRPALAEKDLKVQMAAALALVLTGEPIEDFIPVFEDALEDRLHGFDAARSLARAGPKAAGAIPVLLGAFKKGNREAGYALGVIGLRAELVVPALIAAVSSERPNLRSTATRALRMFGPKAQSAIPVLLEVITLEGYRGIGDAGRDWQRIDAVAALARIGPDDERVISVIADLLKDRNTNIRWHAAYALERIGPKAQAAVPSLIEALGDSSIAKQCTSSLVAIGLVAVPDLVRSLASEKDGSIGAVQKVLLKIGRPAIPDLIKGLNDPSWRVRMNAAFTLGRMGPGAKTAVEDLTALLGREPKCARAGAYFALHYLAAESGAISGLVGMLKDEDEWAQYMSVKTLALIGPGAGVAVKELVARLKEEKTSRIREWIPYALSRIGASSPDAAAGVAFALKDSDAKVRVQAARALANSGQPKIAVPALMQSLSDPVPRVQLAAIQALGNLGPAAKDASEELTGLLKKPELREASSSALKQFGAAAVPALVKGVRSKDLKLRYRTAVLLGEMGPVAGEAVQALEDVKDEGPKTLRRAVAKALKSVQAP